MPGARCARKPRVQEVVGVSTRVSQVTPESPGIPRAMVLRLITLPGDRAFLPPSSAGTASRELDASVGASGPHAFAVRLTRHSSKAHSASTASCPASVTISSRPSVGQDGDGYRVICIFGKSEYFCKRGWTEGAINCPSDLPVGQNQSTRNKPPMREWRIFNDAEQPPQVYRIVIARRQRVARMRAR